MSDLLQDRTTQSELCDAWEVYQTFETHCLPKDGELKEFIFEWETRMKNALYVGCGYSDLVLAFKLLERANLETRDIRVILSSLTYPTEEKSLLQQAQTHLWHQHSKAEMTDGEREVKNEDLLLEDLDEEHSELLDELESQFLSTHDKVEEGINSEDQTKTTFPSQATSNTRSRNSANSCKPGRRRQSYQVRRPNLHCQRCGETFKSRKKCVQHEEHCTSEDAVKVEEVNNVLEDPTHIDDFDFDPGDKKKKLKMNYICETCGKTCKSWGVRMYHLKMHNNERNFPCDICKRTFFTLGHMNAHRKIHTGDKPWVCDKCGRSFINKSSLRDHARTHTGERIHTCQECGKSFSHSSTYSWHKKVHTDSRPYKCKYCPQTFKRPTNLIRHERSHTGERPYECTVCHKAFKTSSARKKHELIHARSSSVAVNNGLAAAGGLKGAVTEPGGGQGGGINTAIGKYECDIE